MVDGRHAPRRPARGQMDARVVDELRKLMDHAADGSTRTVSYYFTRALGIRHDPYDIRLLWLRDHHEGRWITLSAVDVVCAYQSRFVTNSSCRLLCCPPI